jgi:hypothetical protein
MITAQGVMLVKMASDADQASYEKAACLANIIDTDPLIAGVLAIFDFVKDDTYADTTAPYTEI